jgi:hypothetical protein
MLKKTIISLILNIVGRSSTRDKAKAAAQKEEQAYQPKLEHNGKCSFLFPMLT